MSASPSNRAKTGLRNLLWPGLCAVVAFAILVWLGGWQMQRLQWKSDILAKIAARVHAAPTPLPPPSQWQKLADSDYEYTRVHVSGTFDHTREALIFRSIGDDSRQPGYHVITPLRITGTDHHILINRGFVTEAMKTPASRAAGQIEGEQQITGLLRALEARTPFTPDDRPDIGLWFTRNPQAIARYINVDNAAPFSIDADGSAHPGGWPKGNTTVVNIRNDHLAYAMTWYGLAATIIIVFGVFAWSRIKSG